MSRFQLPSDEPTHNALMTALWTCYAPISRYPKVSVITPVYLAARLDRLRSAIDSVRAQTYPEWEHLIVDNSGDDIFDPLPAWWPDDPRVRLLKSPIDREEAGARNHGMASATGELGTPTRMSAPSSSMASRASDAPFSVLLAVSLITISTGRPAMTRVPSVT